MISGHAIATLVVFIISTFFVIHPVSIPTPRHIPRIPLNLTTAPILAIALLWATQCLDSAVIRGGVVGTEGVKPYNVLILFFSLAYMAVTLDITGILQAAAFWVSNKGGYHGWRLYLYFYVMLTLLSILLGNDPVILSGTAFLVYYTQVAELNPTAWIMAEFAAANTASMVLFVGNPTNVVICEGFSVNNAAFTAYTILPFVACHIFCFAALAFQFRYQVPRKLTRAEYRDPRSALLDPVGALVGSLMLGAALILCLVASFFGIDVWMISLPFAVGKFLFDLGWDHYRYTHRNQMLRRGSPRAVEEQSVRDSVFEMHQSTKDIVPRHLFPINVVLPFRHSSPSNVERSPSYPHDEDTAVESHPATTKLGSEAVPQSESKTSQPSTAEGGNKGPVNAHFPASLLQLSFSLAPFAFSRRPAKDSAVDTDVLSSPPDEEPTVGSYPETAKIESEAVGGEFGDGFVVQRFPFTVDQPVKRLAIADDQDHLTTSRDQNPICRYGVSPRHHSPTAPERSPCVPLGRETVVASRSETMEFGARMVPQPEPETPPQFLFIAEGSIKKSYVFRWHGDLHPRLNAHFPTLVTAYPRLPFSLVPFAFSQFILVEALNHQGWVNVFANWLVRASHKQMHPTIWLIGVLGIILCNLSGTNIGATVLLTKIVRAAALPYEVNRAAAIALAVASNIGAVSFTFSASLVGLLWRSILKQKGIYVRQRDFAFWNLLPLLAMTTVGLGVVSAELAVLFS